jgi:hypothetical protein
MWNCQWIEVFNCLRDMDMLSSRLELMLKKPYFTWMEPRLMEMLSVHDLHFRHVQKHLHLQRQLQSHLKENLQRRRLLVLIQKRVN